MQFYYIKIYVNGLGTIYNYFYLLSGATYDYYNEDMSYGLKEYCWKQNMYKYIYILRNKVEKFK